MGMYRLTLDVKLRESTDDVLADRLVGIDGITSVVSNSNGLTVTLLEEGRAPADALAAATERTLEAVERYGGGPGEVIAAVVSFDAEDDSGRADLTFPELVGIAEIADLLKVSRQRANALQARDGFPEPVARLRSGPVWRLTDLSAFARAWEHQPDNLGGVPISAPPIDLDLDKLIGTLNHFNPSPVARNAIKLVRWYAKKPKG